MNLKGFLTKIKAFLKSKQNQTFIIFLIFSFISWFMVKLPKDYRSVLSFDIEYINPPKNIEFLSAPPLTLEALVKTSGLKLLRYKLSKNILKIDLSSINGDKTFLINQKSCQDHIKASLDDEGISIISSKPTHILIRSDTLETKVVKINKRLLLPFKDGYQLTNYNIEPEEIKIFGAKSILDTISELLIKTPPLKDISKDFSYKTSIIPIKNVRLDSSEVTVSGEVVKIAEKVFSIPITPINIPKGMSIKIFPKKINILCKGNLGLIKRLSEKDFKIIFDYSEYSLSGKAYQPHISSYPDGLEVKMLFDGQIDVLTR